MECCSTGIVDKKNGRVIYFPVNALLKYSITPILTLGRRPSEDRSRAKFIYAA